MKSLRWVNLFLLVALVISVGLQWAIRRDATLPNQEFIPEMAHSVAYDSYAPNPVFADRMTLQAPPPGTIARGHSPIHYQATPEYALRAGAELVNPYSHEDPRALDRGAFVFSNFCQTCHGPAGMGDGPVVMRGFPAPPSLLAPRAVQMKDGQMFHTVTYGQRNMASYASQLSREDRWKVIVYIRAMQKRAAVQPAAAPAKAGTQTGGQQ